MSDERLALHATLAVGLAVMSLSPQPALAKSFGERWGAPVEYYAGQRQAAAPETLSQMRQVQAVAAPGRVVDWQAIAQNSDSVNNFAMLSANTSRAATQAVAPRAFNPQARAAEAERTQPVSPLARLQPVRHQRGHYKIGSPYQVNGTWYIPHEAPGYDETGTASWYGAEFHGRPTANGEIYDATAITAAHPTLPLPSLVEVTDIRTGRSLVVRVNDRGPFTDDRIIDLSVGAAQQLGIYERGTGEVRVQYVGPADLDLPAPRVALHHEEVVPPPAVQSAPLRQAAHITRSPSQPVVMPASFSPPAPVFNPVPQPMAYGLADGRITAPQPIDHGVMHDERGMLKHGVALQRPRVAPSGIFVQAASYRDEGQARAAVQSLGQGGPVFVQPAFENGANAYRVMVGPWPSADQAEDVRGRLRELGFRDARVKNEV